VKERGDRGGGERGVGGERPHPKSNVARANDAIASSQEVESALVAAAANLVSVLPFL